MRSKCPNCPTSQVLWVGQAHQPDSDLPQITSDVPECDVSIRDLVRRCPDNGDRRVVDDESPGLRLWGWLWGHHRLDGGRGWFGCSLLAWHADSEQR